MTTTHGTLGPSALRRRALPRLAGRSRPLQVVLDLALVGLGIATFAQVAPPDVLLHCLWIVLIMEAFVFGFRMAVVRLAIAFTIVASYALIDGIDGPFGLTLAELDLAEWPLMMVIAVVVAVMADRLTVASERSNQRLLRGQEAERRRIALDLHDGVGQTLAALTYTLDALETSLASGGDPVDARAALPTVRRARGMANMALDETRDVASRLRPLRLAETGLAAAVEELVAASTVPVDVAIAPELRAPGILSQAAEVEVLRIVQEALANSIRHADAERRWIRLEAPSRDRLVVSVGDDGIGFDTGSLAGEGLGMHSMLERATSIGGRLEVVSRPGHGSLVRVELPRRAERSGRARARRVAPAAGR